MQRRHLILSCAALAMPAFARAQALEKPKTTIAVGGKNLLYYLPLTIAEQLFLGKCCPFYARGAADR